MKLHQLRYFIAVAEEGSFRQAAKRLHMTQPPLSRAVQGLEHAVGTQLLHRTTRTVTLTAAGAAMLDEARAILTQLNHAITAVQRVDRGIEGNLAIGLSPGCHAWALPELIAPFTRSHPSLDVTTRDASSAEQVDLLDTADIDVGLINLPTPTGDCVTVTQVRQDDFAVWLPTAHWLYQRPIISLSDLRGERLHTRSHRFDAPLYEEIAARCSDAGVELYANPRITCESALVGVLASTPVPTLIPPTFALLTAAIDTGSLIELRDPPQLRTAIVSPVDGSNAAADAFCRAAQPRTQTARLR